MGENPKIWKMSREPLQLLRNIYMEFHKSIIKDIKREKPGQGTKNKRRGTHSDE